MSKHGYFRVAAIVMACGAGTLVFGQLPSGPTAPVTQPATPIGPRISVSPPVFDFGDVWEGAPAKGDFTIQNIGDEPMTLSARSTCGCTVATSPKTPLAPGESTTISISYSTKRSGKAQKKVIISTNDPTSKTFDIPVRGMVKPLFASDPPTQGRVHFRTLNEDSVETKTVKLTNKYDTPLPLKLKEGQRFGPFDVGLKELKPGREYELSVTTNPPLRVGNNNAKVTLATGAEDVPYLTVYLSGRVPPRAVAVPSRLLVRENATRATTRTVRVEYRTEKPLSITEVKSDRGPVQYTVKPPPTPAVAGKLASYVVQVEVPGYSDIPENGMHLEILTDDADPKYQRLIVPVVRYKPGRPTGYSIPTSRKRGVRAGSKGRVTGSPPNRPTGVGPEKAPAKKSP